MFSFHLGVSQGYELLSDGRCKAYTCSTGLGIGCKEGKCGKELELDWSQDVVKCCEGSLFFSICIFFLLGGVVIVPTPKYHEKQMEHS